MKSFISADVDPRNGQPWARHDARDIPVAVAVESAVPEVPLPESACAADAADAADAGVRMRQGPAIPPRSTPPRLATDWPTLLDRAIGGKGVRCVYQPVLDLSRVEIAGYEALSRFDLGPRFGPDAWFAAARRYGVTAELEAITLRKALEVRDELPFGTFLTVNVEPESLCDPRVLSVFAEHGNLAGIAVEATEHRPVEDPDTVVAAFEQLRERGAMISIDQPGSGYSGLPQLADLRPDILKLDRALTEGVDVDRGKADLVRLTVSFANRIGASVLAGVETIAEARACSKLGVHYAQGFLVGRPADGLSSVAPHLRHQLRRPRLGRRRRS